MTAFYIWKLVKYTCSSRKRKQQNYEHSQRILTFSTCSSSTMLTFTRVSSLSSKILLSLRVKIVVRPSSNLKQKILVNKVSIIKDIPKKNS